MSPQPVAGYSDLGRPVVTCDRCGMRLGHRGVPSHTEAHTMRATAGQGYRVPDGSRRTDHHNPAVRKHLRFIAEIERRRT